MKDQFKDMILDLPFDEDVQPIKVEKKKSKAILDEGETVIWQDGPNHSRSVFDKNYTPRFLMSRIFKYGDFFSYVFAITIAILLAGEDFVPVLNYGWIDFSFSSNISLPDLQKEKKYSIYIDFKKIGFYQLELWI